MKKSINTGLLTFLLLCNSGLLFSQETRIELGDKYFEMKAFEKAILFYKNANSKDDKILAKLGDCYYYTSQPENAVIQYERAFPNFEELIKPGNSRSFKKHRLKYALCLLSVGQKEIIDSMKMKTYIKQKENKNLKIVKAIKIFTKIYDIEGLEPRTVDSTLKDSAVNLSINSERSDFGSYIFNDTLYFASSREKEEERKHNKKLYKWNEHPFLEIYKAAINRDESPNTIKFNPTDSSSIVFKTSGHEANLAFVNDTTIIFSGSETDKKGNIVYNNRNVSNLKLQIAKRKKNQWVVDNDSTKLSAALNSLNLENFSIGNPALSPDNKRLFFVSCAPYLSANGQSDIYYVDINVNVEKDSVMSFGEVKSVPEINTSGRESFPFVSWDGALYFSSDGIHKNKEGILQLGLGLLDIYKVDDIDEVIKNSEKKIKQDVKIRHLESPFNSPKDDFAFFMEKPKDSLYAYFSSNRIHPNAKGDDDIYRATMELSSINKVKKFKTIQVYVTDSFSKKPLEDALIELMDADDNVIEKGQTDSTGIYNFEVESDKSFHLRSSLLMYDDDDKIFKTVEGVNSINLSMNPPCEYTVNHEWEKDSIVAESIVEEKLEPILKLLKANPEIKIRIESYTDSRGPDGYNEELSKRRAKASKAYLVKKGIVSDRIITKGYGEKCLLVSDEEILKLSTKEERDDAHLSNRRSLFIIEGCDINLKGCNE